MLVIRLSRIGRKDLAIFRVIVQDKRRHPKRGKIVKLLGTYNPHTKEFKIDQDEAKRFIKNGAQPSRRVAKLMRDVGFKLPKWVPKPKQLKKKVKNPDKLRKNKTAEKASVQAAGETLSDNQTGTADASSTQAGSENSKDDSGAEKTPNQEKEGSKSDKKE